MKKMNIRRYILLALIVSISVACSKHVPTDSESAGTGHMNQYIFFEPRVMNVVETKADLITSLPEVDGTAFGVLGYYEDGAPIFNDYTLYKYIAKVYRSSGIYVYDNLAPWQGSTHTFHAFYPYADLYSSISVSNSVPYIDYTQPSSPSGMKDVLGSYTQVLNTPFFSSVQLHFQHLLWAFNLVVKNSQTVEITSAGEIANPSITINKVVFSLSDFPQKASLFLNANYDATPSTSLSSFSYTLYSSETGETLESNQSRTYSPLLFIPVQGLKYQVTIEYTTASGIADTMVYPAEGQYKSLTSEFERGKLYNLTINKTNDKFFEVEGLKPEDWTSNEFEHTFQ